MKLTFHPALLMLVGCIASCSTVAEKEAPAKLLPAAGLGINGVMILVKDLDSARNYYTSKLGFAMPRKFDKGLYSGTLSAYLSFADFSSLELVGIEDSAQASKDSGLTKTDSFIGAFVKEHEGARLYSISTSSVDTTGKWLRSQGFKTDTPQSGRVATEIPKGWDWDDGGPQWRNLAFNANNPPAELPSFMEISGLPYQEIQEEWTPYAWRKYYRVHPNGVVGMSYLQIVVSDLKEARKKFKQIGLLELAANDSTANFQIANGHQLHLIEPRLTAKPINKT
ncbi:MAG: hypothetical protein EOP49_23365, partial [Sphingobacteriales bacterium]